MAASLAHHDTGQYLHAAALEEMASAALLVGNNGLVFSANRRARALLNCDPAPGVPLEELFARCGLEGRLWVGDRNEGAPLANMTMSDGRVVQAEACSLSTGGSIVTLADISTYVREAERARIDALTGLSNRAGLHGTLAALLERGEPVALFYLDLDRFKNVNDTLGHQIGDSLLRKASERLAGLVEPADIAARLGGDEFAVVKHGRLDLQDAAAFASRLVDLLGRTYVIDGHMLNVGASVGVAFAPSDGSTGDDLLKSADLALYRAKAEGRGRFVCFEPEMEASMQARRAIELDLRRALALKEFELVYQPQIELMTHEVGGFEALLRWNNAERGAVAPGAFIPIAEETGLIVPIGEWVLRTACRAAAEWSQPLSVAVNLSPLQFRSSNLTQTVVSALANSGLEPSRLELEITEGALMDDTETVVSVLKNLRALGVRVSMDDFGTGYSSLSYLQKFPFDKIKIDQSFVRDMSHNEEAGAIVRAVARLGSSLGMKVTAEGVETEEQLAAIRAEGCNQVQGYLTGRPMAVAEAAALIDRARLTQARNYA